MKDNILIQNRYYPSGLSEQKVFDYYHKNKKIILNEIKQRPVIIVLAVDVNKFVFKRYNNENDLIYLSDENYDNFIHKRVISLFVELGSPTNIWCIDIDPGNNVKEDETKDALSDIINIYENLIENGYMYKNSIRITSTSRGYHVFGKMKKRNTYTNNILEISNVLKPLNNKYVINKRRVNEGDIVIDLSVMRRRGSHVVPNSLNRNGLICKDVTNIWHNFKRTDAKI